MDKSWCNSHLTNEWNISYELEHEDFKLLSKLQVNEYGDDWSYEPEMKTSIYIYVYESQSIWHYNTKQKNDLILAL